MKLELEFNITETSDDIIEGTFNGHDKYALTQSVAICAISHYLELEFDWNKSKLGVSLFEENGKEIDCDSMHGIFVAYKDGVPA